MKANPVIITATSSGYGKAIAKKFARQDWNVIATMRSPEKETELTQLENVMVTHLDVKEVKSIQTAIQAGKGFIQKTSALKRN